MQYEVRVIRRGDLYELCIPELGLRTKGDRFDEAYAAIIIAKNNWVRELLESGLDEWIVRPFENINESGARGGAVAGSIRDQLRLFFVKAVVIGLFVLLSSLYIAGALSAAGDAVGTAISNVGAGIYSIGEWPAEKVEQYRVAMHKTAVNIRPLVRELAPAFREESQNSTAQQSVPFKTKP